MIIYGEKFCAAMGLLTLYLMYPQVYAICSQIALIVALITAALGFWWSLVMLRNDVKGAKRVLLSLVVAVSCFLLGLAELSMASSPWWERWRGATLALGLASYALLSLTRWIPGSMRASAFILIFIVFPATGLETYRRMKEAEAGFYGKIRRLPLPLLP